MNESRFSKTVVETLQRRAANICSNPECRAPTAGPADEIGRSINIGEAAHIYGANPGSARYQPEQQSINRSDIANGIWLCSNCHGAVDRDAARYPAPLLFLWRRTHEAENATRLGKPNPKLLLDIMNLDPEFQTMSKLAQQIVLDKPHFWEYKLTVELLQSGLEPIMWRWKALSENLYAAKLEWFDTREAAVWFQMRIAEMIVELAPIEGIINRRLPAAWGEQGRAGSEKEIKRVCDLLIECGTRFTQWEERVKFAKLPEEFEECQALLLGRGGYLLEKIFEIPQRLSEIFSVENPSGLHTIDLVFETPEGWSETFGKALQDAVDRAQANI